MIKWIFTKMSDTVSIYWLALKYWLSGDDWEKKMDKKMGDDYKK